MKHSNDNDIKTYLLAPYSLSTNYNAFYTNKGVYLYCDYEHTVLKVQFDLTNSCDSLNISTIERPILCD